MPDAPTISAFYREGTVTDADLDAAVDAVLADAASASHPLAKGVVVDLPAAMRASPWATGLVARADVGERSKRDAVKSAILIARATR